MCAPTDQIQTQDNSKLIHVIFKQISAGGEQFSSEWREQIRASTRKKFISSTITLFYLKMMKTIREKNYSSL
jgi:hypothetical protein